jgi:hypothetical protein
MPSTDDNVADAQAPAPAPTKVYLAGDWNEPPVALAARMKAHGYEFVSEWWDNKATHTMNVPLLTQEISSADLFVLDMRSTRFNTHPMAGSHIGVGVALALQKRVVVLLPVDATKPYTSLVLPYCSKTEEVLFT